MLKQIYQHKCYLCTGELIVIDILENSITACLFDSESSKKDVSNVASYTVTKDKSLNIYEQIIEISFSLDKSDKYFLAAIDALFAKFTLVDCVQVLNLESRFDGRLSEKIKNIWMIGNYIYRDTFYQQQGLWVQKSSSSNVPLKYTITDKKYHPIRNTTLQELLYQRYIPWLQKTLAFKVFDMDEHLSLFHQWMNDEEINDAWQEAGSLDEHQSYIQSKLMLESHTIPLISYLDDNAFGYFEVYWSKEDKISSYYQADDFDRGWHVLIGDKNCRGKEYVSAWMPSMSHFLFLDNCRTNTIVIEPRIDSHKMKKSLRKSGYAYIKNIDFPHKRAMFHTLNREHFFKSNLLLPSLSK